jgi:hypothetical protein
LWGRVAGVASSIIALRRAIGTPKAASMLNANSNQPVARHAVWSESVLNIEFTILQGNNRD